MKAAIYRRYGSPDVVEIADVDKPVPKVGEVLIKVRAASINPFDWHFLRGQPYFIRLSSGLSAPGDPRLGVDVAGQVEAIGSNVTRIKPGDEVFGFCRGALAEYACAPDSAVVLKPPRVTFDEAAAIPIAASTALQGLRDNGHIASGQVVLINGAAGGVGTFAVQIARSLGATVIGVCSTTNLELVRSIGAERVIDYTREDFTESGQRYDLMLDCIGNRSLAACRRVLTRTGMYVAVGAPSGPLMIAFLTRVIMSPVLSRLWSQTLSVVQTKRSADDLTLFGDLLATGKIRAVIDRRYPLSEAAHALRYLEAGHARGKVVIVVGAAR